MDANCMWHVYWPHILQLVVLAAAGVLTSAAALLPPSAAYPATAPGAPPLPSGSVVQIRAQAATDAALCAGVEHCLAWEGPVPDGPSWLPGIFAGNYTAVRGSITIVTTMSFF